MEQDYNKYTAEDHEVWAILQQRMMQILPSYSSKEYLHGITAVGFQKDSIPNFKTCNSKLLALTGWTIYAVPGLIDNNNFFEHLSKKEFPATTWIRKKSELDYLEEPDMFHDVFGHIPLLANAAFANFLEKLAAISLQYISNDWAIELISRLYWYTVEFGLIKEEGHLKVYGAGILSSSGETKYSIESNIPQRVPYNIDELFATPYIKDKFQEKYFVIASYGQLYESIPEIEAKLAKAIAKK